MHYRLNPDGSIAYQSNAFDAEAVSLADNAPAVMAWQRARKIAELDIAFAEFGARHYPAHRVQQLLALMMEAMALSYANRLVYIQQAITWQKQVAGYFLILRDAVNAAETIDAVQAIAPDWTAFSTMHPDPLVTVEAAGALNN